MHSLEASFGAKHGPRGSSESGAHGVAETPVASKGLMKPVFRYCRETIFYI